MKFADMVKNIKEFGFNTYEAKILSYLLLRNEATAPEMSKNLEIPNTKIYYVLEKLVNKGYIKKREISPAIYYIENKLNFFDNVLNYYKSKFDHLTKLKDLILSNLTFSTDTKVVVSKSEFLYYVSMSLNNVKILCGKENKKCIDYVKDKRSILNVFYLENLPFFILLSDEIFLFGVFNKSEFVVGFVTSECLDRFGFVFNV